MILSIVSLSIVSSLYYLCKLYYKKKNVCFNDYLRIVSSIYSIHSLLIKLKSIDFVNNVTKNQSVLFQNPLLLNLTFIINRIYHHDGIAYDYYSQNDLGQSKASYQWKLWPIPHEINCDCSFDSIKISPFVVSKLPFVDVIYVITDRRLTQRHDNLKKALRHQGISNESIEWRMKWDKTACNSNLSLSYIYQRLNLKDKPLGNCI